MSAVGFATEEAFLDALHEARLDDHADYGDDGREADTECPECGFEWNCGPIRATRHEPADCRFPDCPACGS